MIDLLFPLSGFGVFPGYQYPLYSAIKAANKALAEHAGVRFGPIENVVPDRGLLKFVRQTYWRVRAPSADLGRWVSEILVGFPLQIGSHIVVPRPPMVADVLVSSTMHAEMVCIRSLHFRSGRGSPNLGEFTGWFADKLKRRVGVGRSVRFRVGRRRRISVGPDRVPTIGYATEVRGLAEDQAWELMDLGGRKHMGGSMWLTGELPMVWYRDNWIWCDPYRGKH
jgi:hypothetical protein